MTKGERRNRAFPCKEYCNISRVRTYIASSALALASFTAYAGGTKGLIVSFPVMSSKQGFVVVGSHKCGPARTHQASLLEILPDESASFLSPSAAPSTIITPSTLTELTGQHLEAACRQKGNKKSDPKEKLKAKLARIRKPQTQSEISPYNLEGWTPSVVDIAPSELKGYLPGEAVPSQTAPPSASGNNSDAMVELHTSCSPSIIEHDKTSLIPPSLGNILFPSLLPHFSLVEQEDRSVPAAWHSPAKLSGFANLKLETVSADTSPFPALTPASVQALMAFSPALKRLAEIVQQGQNPLREQGKLSCFLRSLPDETESYRVGNHSLVIKRRDSPGHVAKIARSNSRDAHRFKQELQLYQYTRKPGMEPLAMNTCPLLKAFCFAGRPVLVMEQIDFIADQKLMAMKGRSLFDRLNFALTWLWRFCDVYRLFLEHGILLADRHGGNIGFNETRLPAMPELDFPGATLRVPVMLDLDPYWKDDTGTVLRLILPTWIPVAMDLLERAFHPGEMDDERRDIHNHLRNLAMPGEHVQAECQTEQWQGVKNLTCKNINFWLGSQEESRLKDEAKQWLPQLFTLSGAFHDKARTVREWTEVLQTETERIISILSQWKACSRFGFMEDCYRTRSVAPLTPDQNRQKDNASQPQASSRILLAHAHAHAHADIQCNQCSRCFRSLDEYNTHYKNHELGRIKVCDACDGGYTCLTIHRRTHTGDKPFECEHCSKRFADQSNLKSHQRTHTGDKPFECEHCGKGFADQSNLKRHLRTHTGAKPFQCEHCGNGFIDQSKLKRHLYTHTGKKPFPCSHINCNKRFTTLQNMKRHLYTHTGEKPFLCTYQNCDKSFITLQNMEAHRHTHTGNKPYKCEYPGCSRCFTDPANLIRHLRTHTAEKPYKCKHPGCDKRYSRGDKLKKHLRTHTGEKTSM